mmetsp:Transcript_86485/g.222799  ORF Transcript_86485/g.222799 Transcript_86485/m.222799 type:complete len:246 (-) Transcript_86485:71-808(-)
MIASEWMIATEWGGEVHAGGAEVPPGASMARRRQGDVGADIRPRRGAAAQRPRREQGPAHHFRLLLEVVPLRGARGVLAGRVRRVQPHQLLRARRAASVVHLAEGPACGHCSFRAKYNIGLAELVLLVSKPAGWIHARPCPQQGGAEARAAQVGQRVELLARVREVAASSLPAHVPLVELAHGGLVEDAAGGRLRAAAAAAREAHHGMLIPRKEKANRLVDRVHTEAIAFRPVTPARGTEGRHHC